jgi:two-component system chemotaxis sensor kinase CheA
MVQEFMDPEIYADFVIEAREHLETIEPALLLLEKAPDNLKLLDEIFRPMHSLKGASGFLGLNRMNRLAHKGESVLDELRKGRMRVSAEIMDLILRSTDTLKEMVESLESDGTEGDGDIDVLIRQLDGLLTCVCTLDAGNPQAIQASAQTGSRISIRDMPSLPPYALTIANPEHLSDFLEEAQEIIEALNQALVRAEKNPQDAELINDLFRYFHNLKGNSGIIGYVELNELTHEAETYLNRVRKGETSLTLGSTDVLLSVIDGLEELLRRIDAASGQVVPVSTEPLLGALRGLSGSQDRVGGASGAVSASDTSDSPCLCPVDAEDLAIFEQTVSQQLENMSFALSALSKDSGQKEYVDGLFRSLSSLQNSSAYMNLEDLRIYAERTAGLVKQARDTGLDFSLMLDMLGQEADILEEMVAKALDMLRRSPVVTSAPLLDYGNLPPELAREVAEQTDTPRTVEPPLASDGEDNTAGKDKSKKTSSTIRVDHAKLDHLMNLIGELIINRNRFAMLAKALESGEDARAIAQHLTETTYSMNRISDDLQDTIMHVRMVPVQTVFSKFPRLIRDLSRKSGKQVELVTEGEETELDKSVVEVIGDPLVHLLRNSVDHGLESADVRKSLGKPVVGRVWLRAFHKGNSVLIEVEDDGKGIDPEIMRRKAVEKGLITADDAKSLDDRAARELIFAPGFSTAAQVTDISGRGVGMDVVRNNIKELKGSVQVHSEVGKGSKFILTLPLTLAIIDALMVRVGNDTYAIPLDAVSETTKIPASKISEINKRKATTLRGDVLGLARLGELLDLPHGIPDQDPLPVVIVSINDRRLGLIVDQLLQRQDVVIKSMGDYLGDIPGVSGATIMGDGRVILILDPHEIYRLATARNMT